MLRDAYGRVIDYLRVSVTDECNLSCIYCRGRAPTQRQERRDRMLGLNEMLDLCRVFVRLGIRKIKITGGEPLLRDGLPGLLIRLRKIPGLERLTLTTNGILLAKHYKNLAAAGVDAVNISLNSLDAATFCKIAGVDAAAGAEVLASVLKAIDLLIEEKIKVKINCVPIIDFNSNHSYYDYDALCDIAALAAEKAIDVRFIELMPLSAAQNYAGLPSERVRQLLEAKFGALVPDTASAATGPAKYYTIDGFRGRIGFISALSSCFCESCNRLRLDCTGQLRPCLASNSGCDLSEAVRDAARFGDTGDVEKLILATVAKKPARHNFAERNAGAVEMYKIGG